MFTRLFLKVSQAKYMTRPVPAREIEARGVMPHSCAGAELWDGRKEQEDNAKAQRGT